MEDPNFKWSPKILLVTSLRTLLVKGRNENKARNGQEKSKPDNPISFRRHSSI
jgi:hypothetical protein